MYSAHKAAGGMTSVYRQIGYGCQLIFTQILVDELGLTEEDATWSYEVKRPSGKIGKLSLDGRIPINRVGNEEKRDRVLAWMSDCSARVGITSAIAQALKGVVFEVRQGYKSKDSKRQNADIANAATALAQGYLPVVLLLSSQIDKDLLDRYAGANWLILRGTTEGTPLDSTYLFVREIVGYDLARFFENYSERFRAEIEDVVRTLLTP